MINFIVVLILLIILVPVIRYIVKEKKKGILVLVVPMHQNVTNITVMDYK